MLFTFKIRSQYQTYLIFLNILLIISFMLLINTWISPRYLIGS